MRPALLNLVCCPVCASRLRLAGDGSAGEEEIWEGRLICTGQGHEFSISKGIPYLFRDDDSWRPKQIEAQGWVTLFKQQGIYAPETNPVDFRLPYIDDPDWVEISHAFDLAQSRLALAGDERLLDLGAGRGWAAKHFAAQAGEVVALDIVPDDNVGLGRAYALMEQAQVRFDLLLGDGEKLPLQADRFDVVFSCAALHHATDLPAMVDNIARVLRPGGRLCAIREPCRSVWRDEKTLLQRTAADELAAGIHESLPTLGDYVAALDAAGLSVIHAFPSNVYKGDDTDWPATAQMMGASWGGLDLKRLPAWLKGVASYVARRGIALARGANQPAPYEYVGNADSQAQADILNWCGGELFLMARKS